MLFGNNMKKNINNFKKKQNGRFEMPENVNTTMRIYDFLCVIEIDASGTDFEHNIYVNYPATYSTLCVSAKPLRVPKWAEPIIFMIMQTRPVDVPRNFPLFLEM